MIIENHHNNHTAHILSDEILIRTAEDGLDLLINIYYKGFDKLVFHEYNLTPAFFDLQNEMAGEILQKFSNYRVKLAIVGDLKPMHPTASRHL